MRKASLLLSTALLCAAPGLAAAEPKFEKLWQPSESAAEAPQPTFVASSPNAGEYGLIQLTNGIVADANGGAGVLVGVYDGLADCRHAELTGRCTNTLVSGGRYRFYDNHGTHVAGTVAGRDHGLAPNASVANYAVFDDRRYVATGATLINFWNDAASRGASVASMSFGCTGLALCFTAAEVQAMGSAGLSGTLFVKAAGNDGVVLANESVAVTAAQATAALEQLILVGSVNANGTISSFSNRPGETCLLYSGATGCSSSTQWKYRFLVAPGESIYASLPGTNYGSMSGTSMATPIVSGTVALLQAKWPTLKAQPEAVADILFNSATDLGAPGVDGVYGWGLLNVTGAFQNSGATTIVAPSGETLAVDGRTLVAASVMGLDRVMSRVTAYDQYGRDYRLDQVHDFRLLDRGNLMRSATRTANLGRQRDWSQAFFADASAPQVWAGFGPQGEVMRHGFDFDRSMRAGLNLPMGAGALQLRLTGETETRADFAADPALAPLSFFASSDLLNRSVLASYSTKLSPTTRLVAFGAVSGGTDLNPELRFLEQDPRLGWMSELAFDEERTRREQAGFGLGLWTQADERTVVGVTASTLTQRHAFYDLATDLDAFDHRAQVSSLGVAATREYGRWDVFGAAETTHLKAPGAGGPLQFSDAVLVSGEVGARLSGVFADGRRASDTLAVSLVAAPQAVSGALRLNFLERTADGLERRAADLDLPLSELTGRTLRVQGAYTLKLRERLSFGVSGGADVSGDEAGVSALGELHWTF